jgi:hypothetical protein
VSIVAGIGLYVYLIWRGDDRRDLRDSSLAFMFSALGIVIAGVCSLLLFALSKISGWSLAQVLAIGIPIKASFLACTGYAFAALGLLCTVHWLALTTVLRRYRTNDS